MAFLSAHLVTEKVNAKKQKSEEQMFFTHREKCKETKSDRWPELVCKCTSREVGKKVHPAGKI